MDEQGRWFVGIDWGSAMHHVCVVDGRGCKLGEKAFAHGGAGLAELVAWILDRSGAAPEVVHVAIEVPHGPVVESLMERGFRVHAINPSTAELSIRSVCRACSTAWR